MSKGTPFTPKDIPDQKEQVREAEIKQEIRTDKDEIKSIKKETLQITKKEIKDINELDHDLKRIIHLLDKQDQAITPMLIDMIHKLIIELGPKLQSLMKGLVLINRSLEKWKPEHGKVKINFLATKLKQTKDQKKRSAIKEELTYHKQIYQSYLFIQENEQKLKAFYDRFVGILKASLPLISNHNFERAVKYIKTARHELNAIKHLFKVLKSEEKRILKLDKKIIRDLKYEKAA